MRTGPLISGITATVASLALLGAGGGLVLIEAEKDHDGYLTTSTERFATPGRAIATENIDLDLDEGSWFVSAEDFGKARLRIDASGDKPVFAGVARTRDVERYLDGSSHATLTDIDADPFRATTKEHFGSRRPGAPAKAGFWEASTTGTGERDLVWDVDDGDWSVVVMNADGSPGVSTTVSAGAQLPDLGTVGWSTMGGGGLLLIAGVALIVVGTRPPKDRSRATVKVPAPA